MWGINFAKNIMLRINTKVKEDCCMCFKANKYLQNFLYKLYAQKLPQNGSRSCD